MTDLEAISRLHANCGCIERVASVDVNESITLNYKGCRLVILGLRLVIECDNCTAFGSEDSKPDLFILRETRSGYEWLVVEIKSVMDRGAGQQVQSGIDKITTSPMFAPLRSAKCEGLFANMKANRTSNVDALRKSLKSQGRRIPARVERCGNNKHL